MPIPDFDHNNVIPPHLGDPRQIDQLSPYECTIIEFCNRFSTSKERIDILKGLINFRQKITENGIINGFQWLDGSFLENIEEIEKRPPSDLDIVTFYNCNNQIDQDELLSSFPEFSSSIISKDLYKLDHYPVDYCYKPDFTVEATRYWIQLFTHNRKGVWKGIIKISLNTPKEDEEALKFISEKIL